MTDENRDPLTEAVEEKERGELHDEEDDESLVQKRKRAERDAVSDGGEDEQEAGRDDETEGEDETRAERDEGSETEGEKAEEADQNQYGGSSTGESAIEQTERMAENDDEEERSDDETVPHDQEEQEEESPRDQGA